MQLSELEMELIIKLYVALKTCKSSLVGHYILLSFTLLCNSALHLSLIREAIQKNKESQKEKFLICLDPLPLPPN